MVVAASGPFPRELGEIFNKFHQKIGQNSPRPVDVINHRVQQQRLQSQVLIAMIGGIDDH